MCLESCEQLYIPHFHKHCAFSIMLVVQAHRYYYELLNMRNFSLVKLVPAVKMQVKTLEKISALLRKWEAILLTGILVLNLDKSSSSCSKLLIKKF